MVISGSDIATINHKRLIESACLLPEKFSHIQITSPDKKKTSLPKQIFLSTLIPFVTRTSVSSSRRKILTYRELTPLQTSAACAVQRDSRETPKNPHGSSFENSFSVCLSRSFPSASLQTYVTPSSVRAQHGRRKERGDFVDFARYLLTRCLHGIRGLGWSRLLPAATASVC